MASAVTVCGKGKEVGTDDVEVPSSTRDWSELPLDALASVFGKLCAIEILMGAGLACRSWLSAAKLPDLWRSVDMAHHKMVVGHRVLSPLLMEPQTDGDVLCAMARVAVDRSDGKLEAFQGSLFVTDELLMHIGERSPALKTLSLELCSRISNQGFTQLIAKCPILEDLQLSNCQDVGGRDIYQATGMACAQLKRFTLRKECYIHLLANKSSGEALGVAAMHELRSLVLDGSDVTNDELASVLDGCPHLEHLDLRGCINIVVDDALKARCAVARASLQSCSVESTVL